MSDIGVLFIPEKEPKYRTVQLNTEHLATLRNSQSNSNYSHVVGIFARIISADADKDADASSNRTDQIAIHCTMSQIIATPHTYIS